MRLFGMSAWRCLKDITDPLQGHLHGYEVDDAWYRIRDYAMCEFGRFVENMLEDALEDHLRVRTGVLTHAPEGLPFPSPSYFSAYNEPNSANPSFVQTFAIRVFAENNAFPEFVYNVPIPSIDIFDSPRYLNDWMTRIVGYALDHIRPVRPVARERMANWDYGRGESFSDYIYASTPRSRAWPDPIDLPENEKAKALLLSHCTDEQIEQYKRNNWFLVIGGETGACYRIRRTSQINIDAMNGDRVEYRLCTVNDPDYKVPIEDQLLAQKTMIELNESKFLEIAIRW